MKLTTVIGATAALLLAACRAPRDETAPVETAVVVYQNGRVYTVSGTRRWAEAVAVRAGRFLKVGTTAEMKPLVDAGARVVDLEGRFVLPGLIDSHTHPSFEAKDPWHYETAFPWTFVKKHGRLASMFASRARRVGALAASMKVMSSFGITAFGEGKTDPELLPVWETLIREQGLNQHVVMFMHALDAAGPARAQGAQQIVEEFRRHSLPGVRLGAKIFVDGYLEYRTAFLVEPYADADVVGGTTAPPEFIHALVSELDAAGIPIQAHAIGDGAVRLSLDAFEAAMRKRAGRNGPVHTVVHLKLVHPDDIPRFARLGVAASPSPWLAQPAPSNDVLAQKLGSARVVSRYLPLRALWDAGVIVGAHSDWASATMNPFYGMYVGVTRGCPHHPEWGKLGPKNAMTLEQMIRSYTINNATLLGMAQDGGSIESGKWADLVVLDRDILERPIDELLETHVVKTIFQGRVVYEGSMKLPDPVDQTERGLLELGEAH